MTVENLDKKVVHIYFLLFSYEIGETPDKLRQQKCRERRKKDGKAYQDYLEKDRLKKRLKRLENKQKPPPEQEAHKVAEGNRVRNCQIQKKESRGN